MSETGIGLRGICARLGANRVSVEDMGSAGLLESEPARLRELGFSGAHLCEGRGAILELAAATAKGALADAKLSAGEIDVVIWASALPANHLVAREAAGASAKEALLANFRYSGGWLQEQLGMERAQLLAVTQQGCCTMFTALRMARALLLSEPEIRHVLCVGADVLPEGSPREIMYNLISDAGCAVVISRDAGRERWMGFRQVSKGYYWDTIGREKEIIAAYFPTARGVIGELLEVCGVTPGGIDLVIPTGVSRASWEILLRLAGIESAKLYDGGLSFGHTIAADNFLFLQRLREENRAAPGSRMLLFTYGFGSSWCALMLEH